MKERIRCKVKMRLSCLEKKQNLNEHQIGQGNNTDEKYIKQWHINQHRISSDSQILETS